MLLSSQGTVYLKRPNRWLNFRVAAKNRKVGDTDEPKKQSSWMVMGLSFKSDKIFQLILPCVRCLYHKHLMFIEKMNLILAKLRVWGLAEKVFFANQHVNDQENCWGWLLPIGGQGWSGCCSCPSGRWCQHSGLCSSCNEMKFLCLSVIISNL